MILLLRAAAVLSTPIKSHLYGTMKETSEREWSSGNTRAQLCVLCVCVCKIFYVRYIPMRVQVYNRSIILCYFLAWYYYNGGRCPADGPFIDFYY